MRLSSGGKILSACFVDKAIRRSQWHRHQLQQVHPLTVAAGDMGAAVRVATYQEVGAQLHPRALPYRR